MFWIIIGTLGTIVFIVLGIREDGASFGVLYGCIGILITVLFTGAFGILIGCVIPADELYEENEIHIVALKDGYAESGRFYLGGGYIDSDLYYYYITQNDDGGKEVHKIKSDNAVIYDNEASNYRIVEVKTHHSNWFVRFLFFTEKTKYKVYIPKESIKYDFVVDLE